MKRAILLGIAVLFVSGMVMAVEFNADGAISGDYTGDSIHIAVSANAAMTTDGDLTGDALFVTDTTVGAIGSLTINAAHTVQVNGNLRTGAGSMGTINVDGTLNVTGLFDFDGIAGLSGADNGVYAALNVTGTVNGGTHMIFGGYDVGHPADVTISGTGLINAGLKPVYIGGLQGTGTVTMSGSAELSNTGGLTGYYDNQLNVGWTGAGTGKLIVESGNTVKFRHITVKAGGTVEYILDAGGSAAVLTAELPADVLIDNPAAGVDAFFSVENGGVLDLNTAGVAGGILVAGYAVDIATVESWSFLRWDTIGTYEATLAVDGVVQAPWATWRLREKPGDVTTLQAFIIPEPTTMALLGLGGLLAALRRRS